MEYANFWKDTIRASDRYYETWASKFNCAKLEEYYEGFQWKDLSTIPYHLRPYTINLVYATIEQKIFNMLLNNPQFEVEAKPAYSDWDAEVAYDGAQIKQDALNTVIENPNLNFVDTIKLAALDYFFRFSVIEVGYSAEWENPNKKAPVMKSDYDPTISGTKNKVVEEISLPLAELLYWKWIPARRFRVSLADSPFLRNCHWCGYYSYYYREMLEKTEGINFKEGDLEINSPHLSPEYRGPDRIIGSNRRSSATDEDDDSELKYLLRSNDVLKMWTIWDNKTLNKLLIHDQTGKVTWKDYYSQINLATHRANYRLKGWYPIPPVWYWISPQQEINEAREQMRNYRRRFKRKFWYLMNKIENGGIDKLTSDTDGEAIGVKEREAIGTIQNPEIGISIEQSLSVGFSDFNYVSGSAQVKESDRETATKSKIIASKEGMRESVERQNFDSFVCEVGRLAILTMSERFTLAMWVKYSADPSEDFLGEVNIKGPAYRQIQAYQLDDGYDYTVKLRVIDGSEVQTAAEMQKFVAFLSVVNQFPQIMLSPVLIREAAYKTGYRNIKVIKEMQNAALLQMMGQAAQAQSAIGQSPGSGVLPGMNNQNAAKSAIANSAPNPTDEINAQLFGQV